MVGVGKQRSLGPKWPAYAYVQAANERNAAGTERWCWVAGLACLDDHWTVQPRAAQDAVGI